jgi:hypothetical protein
MAFSRVLRGFGWKKRAGSSLQFAVDSLRLGANSLDCHISAIDAEIRNDEEEDSVSVGVRIE